MTWIFRQLFAIAVLPFAVAVIIPVWLARRNAIALAPGHTLTQVALQACGVAILGLGLLLFSASLRRFITEGRGTLAPWDPPRHLVIAGAYRYVRNPMISGVLFVLVGEALVLLSWRHAVWASVFLLLNVTFIPLFEEPQLRARFGAAYDRYCRHVPRVVPRLTAWTDNHQSSNHL
jgi:protein-S-isoprenylcysteine O-methyltransferase Ste14